MLTWMRVFDAACCREILAITNFRTPLHNSGNAGETEQAKHAHQNATAAVHCMHRGVNMHGQCAQQMDKAQMSESIFMPAEQGHMRTV